MEEESRHLADEQLLLHASGEIRDGASGEVRFHLEGCADCRSRMELLESTLAEFGEAQHGKWDRQLPPGDGARALLTERLTAIAAGKRPEGWLRSLGLALSEHGTQVFAGAAVVVVVLLLAMRIHGPAKGRHIVAASFGLWDRPDVRLTPGATVPVTENQVCGEAAERPVPAVPVSLKRKVFEEYGVIPPQPDAYEVDYLITPELGGATDIRNLWPEPYHDVEWNAHVKDQLEDRLRVMVCRGELDLATAQHDLSADWITAYRMYFHVDKPIPNGSSPQVSHLRRSPPARFYKLKTSS
jgi:hypothetical protein